MIRFKFISGINKFKKYNSIIITDDCNGSRVRRSDTYEGALVKKNLKRYQIQYYSHHLINTVLTSVTNSKNTS